MHAFPVFLVPFSCWSMHWSMCMVSGKSLNRLPFLKTIAKRQAALLRLELSRLTLQWNHSKNVKSQLVSHMVWIIENLEGVDNESVAKAEKLRENILDHRRKIKEVVNAMSVGEGCDHGGGWSDH
mmetsp:Transcript_3669/g.8029  ORF Transcript_3669/g.8029 Transcript_3669/m.8029 type:complete len:125 (+) Transcript_3669:119-493(+)